MSNFFMTAKELSAHAQDAFENDLPDDPTPYEMGKAWKCVGERLFEILAERAEEEHIPEIAGLRVISAAYEVLPSLDDTRSLRTIISAPPPARHHNLCGLEYHMKERGMIVDEQTIRNSGFLLSDGTYADRHRAAEVAIAAGQVTACKMTVQGTLFSEDLW